MHEKIIIFVNNIVGAFIFTGVARIAAGDLHSMIMKQDGSVWSCGLNSEGQLGIPSHLFATEILEQTTISRGAIDFDAGFVHSIVLKQDSSVWIAGIDLVPKQKQKIETFTFVRVIDGAKSVAAGMGFSFVLTRLGSVWGKGLNTLGQLGDGTAANKANFVPVISDGVKAVSAGHAHSIVVKEDGSVWGTGWNGFGQIGNGTTNVPNTNFVQVMFDGAEAVSAGACHSMVLKQDGTVWTTGRNLLGQLGDGTTKDSDVYRQVSKNAKAVAAGNYHSTMLKQDGSVWTTLFDVYGSFGDSTGQEERGVFIQVIASGARAVAAGSFHSLTLYQDGTVWAAGSNKYGQLGNDGTSKKNMRKFVKMQIRDGAAPNAILTRFEY